MNSIHVIPLNRVEGDLKIQIEVEDGVIRNARSSGTMYRGFENIMVGRGPLDGLVITPRICGMCTTAHLNAAAKAYDMIFQTSVPDNAKRVRNIALITETLQNDIRHGFFLFMPDFADSYYKDLSLFEEAVRRYEPLKGLTMLQSIRESKKLLEIVAIIGGQWPHSGFMVPGGVASLLSSSHILQCRHLLENYRKWYENRILGCALKRWLEVKNSADMAAWMEESDSHRDSDLGFYIRFSKQAGLDKIGKGYGRFISFGAYDMPAHTDAGNLRERIFPLLASRGFAQNSFLPSGVLTSTEIIPFNQKHITEDTACSWFNDNKGPKHPFNGITKPYATGSEANKYSWTKAPRYDALPAETGPLGEFLIARHPLFTNLLETEGPSVFVRELARLVRASYLIPLADLWLREIADNPESFFNDYDEVMDGEGFGLVQAPRGALGHWVRLGRGKIESYQIITPTTWNASPGDSRGARGPWDEALIGTRIRDIDNPIEAGHIIRSYDPCLVCAVHAIC